nr:MAG TPA: hypothetical protein [Caudoviricetes sp.]
MLRYPLYNSKPPCRLTFYNHSFSHLSSYLCEHYTSLRYYCQDVLLSL